MTNPFIDVGERQLVAATKRRHRAAEKRAESVLTPNEQRLVDQDRLLRFYRRAHEDAQLELLASPYGDSLVDLIFFLNDMTLESGDDLVALVKAQAWWDADRDTRCEILHIINEAIGRLRLQHKLPVIDDPLPHEAPSAFVLIRDMLR